jgi:hypothetical protein
MKTVAFAVVVAVAALALAARVDYGAATTEFCAKYPQHAMCHQNGNKDASGGS